MTRLRLGIVGGVALLVGSALTCKVSAEIINYTITTGTEGTPLGTGGWTGTFDVASDPIYGGGQYRVSLITAVSGGTYAEIGATKHAGTTSLPYRTRAFAWYQNDGYPVDTFFIGSEAFVNFLQFNVTGWSDVVGRSFPLEYVRFWGHNSFNSSVVFNSEFPPQGTITFSLPSSPAPVPEIDPAGFGSVAALVTGGLGLIERRRLKAKAA